MQSTLFSENLPPKKRNIAETSRKSFRSYNSSGNRAKEQLLVIAILGKHQPITSRQLSTLTKLERTNITRILFDLTNAPTPVAKIAFEKKCPVTHRLVNWYCLFDFKTNSNS